MAPSLVVFRPTWGLVHDDDGYLSWTEAVHQLMEQGYGGIECSVATSHRLHRFSDVLRQHDLYWIPIVFTSGPIDGADPFVGDDQRAGPGSSWQVQLQAWKCQMDRILETSIVDRVPVVNCFTGHDSMQFGDGVQLFRAMHQWYHNDWLPRVPASVHRPPLLLHETHRGRLLYSPWVTAEYLGAVPDLYLVADFSHWTCVAEFDADPAPPATSPDSLERNLLHETIDLVMDRVRHVQGRVGYGQGPQVPDPRHPSWARHLRLFESWWDAALLQQIADADDRMLTFTPEHGPVPYQQPIGDLSDLELLIHVDQVNEFLAQRQRQRFQRLSGASDWPT